MKNKGHVKLCSVNLSEVESVAAKAVINIYVNQLAILRQAQDEAIKNFRSDMLAILRGHGFTSLPEIFRSIRIEGGTMKWEDK